MNRSLRTMHNAMNWILIFFQLHWLFITVIVSCFVYGVCLPLIYFYLLVCEYICKKIELFFAFCIMFIIQKKVNKTSKIFSLSSTHAISNSTALKTFSLNFFLRHWKLKCYFVHDLFCCVSCCSIHISWTCWRMNAIYISMMKFYASNFKCL